MVEIAFNKQYGKDIKKLTEDENFHLEDLLRRIKYNRLTPGDGEEFWMSYNGKRVYSYRVNNDVRLALFKHKEKQYLVLACDHHDRLYARVRRMDLSLVAPAELPKVIELDIKEGVEDFVKPIVKDTSFDNGLAKISKKQLGDFGLGDSDIEKLIHADSEDLLLSHLEHIKSIELSDALLDIAMNPSCFEERKARLAREKPRRDLPDILKTNPVDRENYFVLTEDLYERFFNGTLEDWQVFLHPDQSRAVEMESNGPMMVTGPAGTGKSVVAVHRVKWLLEHKYKHGGKILFTTFTHTLAEYARKLLGSICTEEEMQRVEVKHFDEYLQDLLKRYLNGVSIEYKIYNPYSQFFRIVTNECAKIALPRDVDFVAHEFDRVISENDIRNLDQYKDIVRPKDLGRLNNEVRTQLWPALNAVDRALQFKSRVPRAVAINRLTDVVDSRCCEFDSIIIDEAQDLGAPEYRLFARLTGNSYVNAVPYSLFFAGDGHQRIYNRSGSLKQCGINVTGRSVKLFKCYRSTKKIREYAEKIIEGVQVKDMDSEADKLLGGESLTEGVAPKIRFGRTKDDKVDYIAESVREWTVKGGKLGDCAVLVNKNIAIDDIVNGLKKRGIEAVSVNRDDANFDESSLKVMTMHRAKGLQFINVVVDVDGWPRKSAVKKQEDEEISKELLDKEKCLLYMSVMRAVSNVFIVGSYENKYIPRVDDCSVVKTSKSSNVVPVTPTHKTTSVVADKNDGSKPKFQKDNGTLSDSDSNLSSKEQEKNKGNTVPNLDNVVTLVQSEDASKVKAYEEFKNWLAIMKKDDCLKLKNYEESAIKYRDAKISNNKTQKVMADWDLKNGADAKVLTEQWGKFVSSRKHIKFDFRDLVCLCIGRNK